MGNAESNVTSGVKKQADTSSVTCYKLVDLKGGGLLVDLMKMAAKTRNYSEVDEAIRAMVKPYLYNGGAGKLVHVAHMVINRNKDRPKHKQLPMLKSLDDPESFNTEKYIESRPEFQWSPDKDQSLFREVCWNLEERGAVGETILHLCFLNPSSILAELAKRLLRIYPKLINDYYISEDYYGKCK
ncbi:uncharacterized protein LOC136041060 isoform X1 [Artemia franciscana]|uniref:uncharacterized protein LOC136041060 isoform X1 n=1 Tax=Artemia franciscana TaxID=6661 RepID=UPI0032DA0878